MCGAIFFAEPHVHQRLGVPLYAMQGLLFTSAAGLSIAAAREMRSIGKMQPQKMAAAGAVTVARSNS